MAVRYKYTFYRFRTCLTRWWKNFLKKNFPRGRLALMKLGSYNEILSFFRMAITPRRNCFRIPATTFSLPLDPLYIFSLYHFGKFPIQEKLMRHNGPNMPILRSDFWHKMPFFAMVHIFWLRNMHHGEKMAFYVKNPTLKFLYFSNFAP